jgi:hypothetical protein
LKVENFSGEREKEKRIKISLLVKEAGKNVICVERGR